MFKQTIRYLSTVSKSGLIPIKREQPVIFVSGTDASKFLNGLLTLKLLPSFVKKNQTTISDADISDEVNRQHLKFEENDIHSSNWGLLHEDEYAETTSQKLGIRRDGNFTTMLNSKGRVISDLFIYPTPFLTDKDNKKPSYLLEFTNTQKFSQILMILKLHKLKANVEIKSSKIDSYFYYNDSKKFEDYTDQLKIYFRNETSDSPSIALKNAKLFIENEKLINSDLGSSILGFSFDERCPNFGLRVLTSPLNVDENKLSETIFSTNFIKNFEIPAIETIKDYNSRRFESGIVENNDYPKGKETLPFENNLDYMCGINYNKGCYVGQELTIRSYFSGKIRRRVMPVTFNKNASDYDDLELKVEKTRKPEAGVNTNAANNPFGNSSKVIKRRKDESKVGDVITHDGIYGLAGVDLKFIDLEEESEKSFIVSSKSHGVVSGLKGTVKVPDWWPLEEEEEEEGEDDGQNETIN